MHFHLGSLMLLIELLLAEWIFLYPAPRRRIPVASCCFLVVIVLFCSMFSPIGVSNNLATLYYSGRSALFFLLSTIAMNLIFELPWISIGSMCVAGYAIQHISYRIGWLLTQTSLLAGIGNDFITRTQLLEICVAAVVYLTAWFTLGRFSARHRYYTNHDIRLSGAALITIFVCIVLSRIPGLFGEGGMNYTGSFYSIYACLLALYIQFSLQHGLNQEAEQLTLDRIRHEQQKQYEISKEVAESLNIRIHDAKHLLHLKQQNKGNGSDSIEELLEKEVGIYDSIVRSDNEDLNVILTEKSMACQRKDIRFTCSGKFAGLAFMNTVDLYSLFGNAIDNAMEAAESLPPDKRVIDLAMEERGDMLFINVVNYFSGSLNQEAGILYTTKTENPGAHGFGMKSMRRIAENYGGDISYTIRGDIFSLNIHIQKPA